MNRQSRARATEILARYDAIRSGAQSQLATLKGADDCGLLAASLGTTNLADSHATLDYGFVAATGGYRPVLTICAKADASDPMRIKVARGAYDTMAKINAVEASPEISASVVSFALPLSDGDVAFCLTKPASAPGDACASAPAAVAAAAPAAVDAKPAARPLVQSDCKPNQLLTFKGTPQANCANVCAPGRYLDLANKRCSEAPVAPVVPPPPPPVDPGATPAAPVAGAAGASGAAGAAGAAGPDGAAAASPLPGPTGVQGATGSMQGTQAAQPTAPARNVIWVADADIPEPFDKNAADSWVVHMVLQEKNVDHFDIVNMDKDSFELAYQVAPPSEPGKPTDLEGGGWAVQLIRENGGWRANDLRGQSDAVPPFINEFFEDHKSTSCPLPKVSTGDWSGSAFSGQKLNQSGRHNPNC